MASSSSSEASLSKPFCTSSRYAQIETLSCRAAWFAFRFLSQGSAQRLLSAIPGQLEQIVIIEAEERTFEHAREREIVLRQQDCIGERHQIHDRNVFGQHKPVGARNDDAFTL